MSGEEERVLGLAPVAPERTQRYGPHREQVVDEWDGGGATVALLHGGFWRERYDRRHLSPLAAHLAGLGYAVASLEYRRVGGGGGHPETFHDVARALAAVRPAVVVGHSAGGQLALWAAACGAARRVVALAPVADLARAVELSTGDGAVDALFHGDRSALPGCDPGSLLPTGVPTTVIHGSADSVVPLELSQRFHAAACAAGDTATRLITLPATGHYALIEPGSPACGVLEDVLERVLERGA